MNDSRRRSPRFAVDLPVRVGHDNAPFAHTIATDISEGGVGLAPCEPLRAGAMVDLWIGSPSEPFYARGCVAHVQSRGVGVELVFASLRERRLLADQVKRLAGPSTQS
jgi:hypothetical protein